MHVCTSAVVTGDGRVTLWLGIGWKLGLSRKKQRPEGPPGVSLWHAHPSQVAL